MDAAIGSGQIVRVGLGDVGKSAALDDLVAPAGHGV